MTRWLRIQLTGPIKDPLPVHPGEVERVQARAGDGTARVSVA